MQVPDWSKWLQMPELELWQAVALSLNVEPDTLGSVCYEDEDGMWYSFHDANTIERFPIDIFDPPTIRDEFIKRKAILEGHVNTGNCFTASLQTIGAHKYIESSEFAVWVVEHGWEIPDQLSSLGLSALKITPTADSKSSTSATESTGLSTTKTADASSENWKLRVQTIAAKKWRQAYDQGCSPTIANMKDAIAKSCREQDVKTTNGVYPSAEYLRTHVLSNKHWKNRPKK